MMRRPWSDQGEPDTAYVERVAPLDRFVSGLCDPRLLVRFAALLAAAVVVFLLTWSLAYFVLPAEVLRGRTGGAVLAGGDEVASTVTVEMMRILAVNIVLATLVVVAANLLRTRRGVPMGYWSVMTLVAVAAVVTGTNSFSIQAGPPGKTAPSFQLLGNPGPYELAAYVLAATATYGIGRWQLAGRWPHSTAPRLPVGTMSRRQVVLGLVVAVLILVVMAAWEATRILATVP